jgi:protein-disulfide isomerase
MALDLNRSANVATLVVAGCAVLATVALLDGRRTNGGRAIARPVAEAESLVVAEWEKYLDGGHSRGSPNAAITILEFGDYECPFCARFASMSEKILAAFPTQVRLVYRHWPLRNHRFAYPAARAAECAAEQGKFWELHDLLYIKHDSLGLISFLDLAKRAGVASGDRFQSCVESTDPVAAIEAGIRDAHAAGGTGTPTLIVNGLLKRRGVDSAYVAGLLAALEAR